MRIKETITRLGYFWIPGIDENKVPGTLTINDGGEIVVEILGLLDNSIEGLNGKDDLSRVVGLLEGEGYITLLDCFYKTKTISFGTVSKSVVKASKAYFGLGFNKEEEIRFNKFNFSVEGLDEWVSKSGLAVTYTQDFRTARISYAPPEEITYQLSSDFNLSIKFGYSLPGFIIGTEAKISQYAYFSISSLEDRDVSDFMEIAFKVTSFLCFATDTTVSMKNVEVSGSSYIQTTHDNKSYPLAIKLYYRSVPFSETPPKISSHSLLFSHKQIELNAQYILRSWLQAYTVIDSVLWLYFSVRYGHYHYLEGKFLALAQAIETYHRRTNDNVLMDEAVFRKLVASTLRKCPKSNRRWLYGRIIKGNELPLGKRLKNIIEPFKEYFGNSSDRNKLIRNIVDTRNYLTHYSNEVKSKAAQGVALYILCEQLEGIIQLHLLSQLGFSEIEIGDILKSNDRLRQKIKKSNIQRPA